MDWEGVDAFILDSAYLDCLGFGLIAASDRYQDVVLYERSEKVLPQHWFDWVCVAYSQAHDVCVEAGELGVFVFER